MTIFKNYCDELDYVKFVMIDLERFPTIPGRSQEAHGARRRMCRD